MNLMSLVPFRGRTSLARPDTDVFGSLQREVDRLFEDFMRGAATLPASGAGLVPSIDISESDNEIEITAELPGLERKEVEISLEDNVLTIRGEKKVEMQSGNGKQGKEGDNKNRRVTERMYGAFYRVIELPPGIDPSKVQATMSKGVLKVTVPKPPHSQPKKIEVKEAA
jgi:HSP20 family protein